MLSSRASRAPLSPWAQARRHERGRLIGPAQLMLAERRIVGVRTLDISVGGVQLVADLNLPLRAACGVRLSLCSLGLGLQTVIAEAEVANCVFSGKESGFLIGLRFTQLAPESRAAIDQYLQERHAGAAAPADSMRLLQPGGRSRRAGHA